ncbi:MAG TPA: hypothetical protein ENK06_08235 [Gammaproteobacteria bacterium]|nr:hypothetical protein [Gammaproteobacteria bacterium]
MKLFKSLLVGVSLSFAASTASAIEGLDAKMLDDTNFNAFAKDMGSALSYKALTPAEPLGITGFDVGIEVTGTSLEGVDQWGAAIGDTSLGILPFPKVHAHKGLPFGVDVGLVYSTLPTADISYIGGEVRYSFVSGNVAMPAIAVRGTYTQLMGVDEVDFNTKGLEATISKGFLMFTPYAGVGNIWTSADLSYSTTSAAVSASSDPSLFKWFVGLNFNMGLMNIVGEVDKTGDAMSYSMKLGFRF